MPELAEVEYYRKQWDGGLRQKILRVQLHEKARDFRNTDTDLLQKTLTGTLLRSSHTHGKQMFFVFGKARLGVHLGMTGALLEAPPDHDAQKHDHLVLYQKKQALVFRDPRMFGRIRFSTGPDLPDWCLDLPPEVNSEGFTRQRLSDWLERRRVPAIKGLLLDQSMFPGIGNWMADEILWRARLHPATPGGELTARQQGSLWKETRQVTEDALEVIGTDWGDAPDEWLFNHRWKDGGHCPRPRCSTALERDTIGGRTSCWCPRCQHP